MKTVHPMHPGEEACLSRRELLAGLATGMVTCGYSATVAPEAIAKDYSRPMSSFEGLTCYESAGQILVRWNNSVAIAYRAHESLKYPYFGPLAGPLSGLSLTTESSMPYPHHRGVWLGCEPLNGGDYWSDGPLCEGQIRSQGPQLQSADSTTAVVRDHCRWVRGRRSGPIADERLVVIRFPSPQLRLIEVHLRLKACEPVVITEAKHSLFALRAAADISPMNGGTLVNSAGALGAESTFGRPAKWCGYFGRRTHHPDIVEGIALLNHPENFGEECPWFTRDYGHLSPSPFAFLTEPWELARGEVLDLKYCVVLHGGTPDEAGIDSLYSSWLAGKGWFADRPERLAEACTGNGGQAAAIPHSDGP